MKDFEKVLVNFRTYWVNGSTFISTYPTYLDENNKRIWKDNYVVYRAVVPHAKDRWPWTVDNKVQSGPIFTLKEALKKAREVHKKG